MRQSILYISYGDVLEPLGQSQVLTYLEGLATGRRIHLFSFEKAQDWRDHRSRRALEHRIAGAEIAWPRCDVTMRRPRRQRHSTCASAALSPYCSQNGTIPRRRRSKLC